MILQKKMGAVVILTNPHDANAINILGDLASVDAEGLATVRYVYRGRTVVRPFAMHHLLSATTANVTMVVERLERHAALLRKWLNAAYIAKNGDD